MGYTRYVTLSRAASLSPHHPDPPNLLVQARVSIDDELSSHSERDARLFYESQARALVEAFKLTLPGGLLDAILLALLEHRASIYRVPYEHTTTPTTEERNP